jgi:hypothetical protein
MAGPGSALVLAEIAAIEAGTSKSVQTKYPYGWQRHQLPRLWRRMFHGCKTSRLALFCVDELHQLPAWAVGHPVAVVP